MAEIVDSTIGNLPPATAIQDDTLMVGEQQGEAVQLTGAQWKAYAQAATEDAAQATFEKNYNRVVSDVLARMPSIGKITQKGSILRIE